MRQLLLFIAAACFGLAAMAQAPVTVEAAPPVLERKLALLIGNQDYPDQIGDLATPHLDVTTVTAALDASGFETFAHFDLERDEMLSAIRGFRNRLAEARLDGGKVFAFVYFAGQGFSVGDAMGDQNLLIASRENVWSSDDLMKQTIAFEDVIATLASGKPDALYVVNDSVREGLALGFTDTDRPTGFVPYLPRFGELVAYSAAAGERAPDDGEFAKTLAREIVVADQLASVAISKALAAIAERRPDSAAPFMDLARMDERFCFNGCPPEPEEEIDLANMRPPTSSINTPQPRAPQVPVQALGELLLGDEASQSASLDPAGTSTSSSSAASSTSSSMASSAAKGAGSAVQAAGNTATSVASGAVQTAVGTQMAAAQVQAQTTAGAAAAAAGLATSGVKAGAGVASAGLKAVTGGGGGANAAANTQSGAGQVQQAANAAGPGAPPPSQAPLEQALSDAPTSFPGPQIATRLPDPAYPEAAIAQDIEGLCKVNFDVSATGVPFNLLASCTDSVFEEESIRAVSQARFEPAMVDGAPAVRQNVEYPLEFTLNTPG